MLAESFPGGTEADSGADTGIGEELGKWRGIEKSDENRVCSTITDDLGQVVRCIPVDFGG